MSRIALLDTNFSIKPMYDFLKSKGHDVFVIGGNIHDSLANKFHNYRCVNYSNLSECLDFIDKNKIEIVLPGGNDLSYSICTQICEKLDLNYLDSYKTFKTIHHKDEFRYFCKSNLINSPKIFDSASDIDSESIIIKPSDAYSGRGTTKISKKKFKNIPKAIELAKSFSKNGKALIEEFVTGELYSHSAFIENGKIVVDFFVEEHCSANQFTVDTSRILGKKTLPVNILESVRRDVSFISDSLSLKDGLIHTQFISDKKNFWIIEITRRCPGDLYSKLIEMSTGYRYINSYTNYFLKAEIDEIKKWEKMVIRHTISTTKEINYQSLSFSEEFNIKDMYHTSRIGDTLSQSPFSRVGVIFIEEQNEQNYDRLYKKFIKREAYKIQ